MRLKNFGKIFFEKIFMRVNAMKVIFNFGNVEI